MIDIFFTNRYLMLLLFTLFLESTLAFKIMKKLYYLSQHHIFVLFKLVFFLSLTRVYAYTRCVYI